LHDFRGALLDLDILLKLEPNNKDAYNNRGAVKANLNDIQGSIYDFNQVIMLDPNERLAYHNRGKQKLKIGDKEGACLDFSKAGELGDEGAYELIRQHCN